MGTDEVKEVPMTMDSSSEEENEDEDAIRSSSGESMVSSESEEEVDVEMNVVERDHPPDIKVDEHLVNICFHPEKNLIALADINGDIHLYEYTNEETKNKITIEAHKEACRDVKFSIDGQVIHSVSADKSILLIDVETGEFKSLYADAHECPIYSTTVLTENTFVTGDEEGTVKLWDSRQKSRTPVFSIKKMEDYVSSMITNSEKKLLVCASGDGSLMTLDLAEKKLHCHSVQYEEEFTCLNLFRNESKILAGSSSGNMYIFNWNEFGAHSDIMKGFTKKSINCMVPITEQVVVTGCEDSHLRAFSIFPHRRLGIVGEHEMSIEAVDISSEGDLIASSSHDDLVKFWNIKYFEDLDVNQEITTGGKQKQSKYRLPSSRIESSHFFCDL